MERLTYIIESGRMPAGEEERQALSKREGENTITRAEEKNQQMETRAGYKGINTFVYSIRERGSQEGIDLIFERRGFADWKLTGMDFHFKGQ